MSKPSNSLEVEKVSDRGNRKHTDHTGQLKCGMCDPRCEASVARAECARQSGGCSVWEGSQDLTCRVLISYSKKLSELETRPQLNR